MKHFLYIIKNKITNKVYVGITNNLRSREIKHLYNLRKNNHHSKKLQNSFNKHGEDNFEFKMILEKDCTREEILSDEKRYIKLYNSFIEGYNMNLGGLENNGFSSKFSKDDVITICTVKEKNKKSGQLLSEIFETSRTSISRICRGLTQIDSYEEFKKLSESEKGLIYNNFLKNSAYDDNLCNNNKHRILNEINVFRILSFYSKFNTKGVLSSYFNCSQCIINSIIKHELYRDISSRFDYSKVDEIIDCWEDIPSRSNNHNRKLSEDKVFDILNDIKENVSRKEICEKFNVTTSTVDRLKKGIIYKDVIEKFNSK